MGIVQQLRDGKARPPFSNGHFIPQHFYIFGANGERHVSEADVLRFECLEENFGAFVTRYNLRGGPLEHTNESEMPRFSMSQLSEPARQLIEQEYSEDFECF